MRLCLLADGSSYHTQRWVDYFISQGDEVHLITLEPSLPTKAYLWQIPSRVGFKALKYLLAYPEVKRLLRRIGPDLVNAHFIPNYGFLAALSGMGPLVVTAWGSDLLIAADRSPFHRFRTRFTLERADLLLSDAEVLSQAAYRFGAPKDRVLTQPWGIDLSRFRPRPRPKGQHRVIAYRRLTPLYNYPQIIRAIPEVVKEIAEVQFLIIGEGPERDRLMKLSRSLGVEGYIRFRGRLPLSELIRELASSEVYLSTARSDSTSVSLLEAMACGVFPIVSDIPGNREWIEDGVNGYLVPISHHLTLARRVVAVIRDPELRDRAARLNRRLVEERADFERNMARLRSHLLRVAEG